MPIHTTIMCCLKCRFDIERRHAIQTRYAINEIEHCYCPKCGTSTDHIARKQFISYKAKWED